MRLTCRQLIGFLLTVIGCYNNYIKDGLITLKNDHFAYASNAGMKQNGEKINIGHQDTSSMLWVTLIWSDADA